MVSAREDAGDRGRDGGQLHIPAGQELPGVGVGEELTHQSGVEMVTTPDGHEMPEDGVAQERHVPDAIQDLVAHEFIL